MPRANLLPRLLAEVSATKALVQGGTERPYWPDLVKRRVLVVAAACGRTAMYVQTQPCFKEADSQYGTYHSQTAASAASSGCRLTVSGAFATTRWPNLASATCSGYC